MTTLRDNEREQETAEEQTVAQASADEELTAEELEKVVGGDSPGINDFPSGSGNHAANPSQNDLDQLNG